MNKFANLMISKLNKYTRRNILSWLYGRPLCLVVNYDL